MNKNLFKNEVNQLQKQIFYIKKSELKSRKQEKIKMNQKEENKQSFIND